MIFFLNERREKELYNDAKLNNIALLVLKIGRQCFRAASYLKIEKSKNLFERFNQENEKQSGCICPIKLHTKFHVDRSKNKESTGWLHISNYSCFSFYF